MLEHENDKVPKNTHTTHSIPGILITCCKNTRMTVSLAQEKHAVLARHTQCTNYVRDYVFFSFISLNTKSLRQTQNVFHALLFVHADPHTYAEHTYLPHKQVYNCKRCTV